MVSVPDKKDLPNDPAVLTKYEEVVQAYNVFMQKQKELQDLIEDAQVRCRHPNMVKHMGYNRGNGMSFVKGEYCPDCKFYK